MFRVASCPWSTAVKEAFLPAYRKTGRIAVGPVSPIRFLFRRPADKDAPSCNRPANEPHQHARELHWTLCGFILHPLLVPAYY